MNFFDLLFLHKFFEVHAKVVLYHVESARLQSISLLRYIFSSFAGSSHVAVQSVANSSSSRFVG